MSPYDLRTVRIDNSLYRIRTASLNFAIYAVLILLNTLACASVRRELRFYFGI
jgi:hypothetical protein